jgi:hypothetical protein
MITPYPSHFVLNIVLPNNLGGFYSRIMTGNVFAKAEELARATNSTVFIEAIENFYDDMTVPSEANVHMYSNEACDYVCVASVHHYAYNDTVEISSHL